jgi:hypothetical protein
MSSLQADDPQEQKGNSRPLTPAAQAERDAYLGETLYHFIGTGSDDEFMYIFDSIVRRGLLMTVGDKSGMLDRLSYEVQGNTIFSYEIMQKARVCFTDIPADKLYNHSGEYGQFGIGFSRQTVISWGGNPVFYVPNHVDGPITSIMGGLIHGLVQAGQWVEHLERYSSGGLEPFMRPGLFGTNDLPLIVGDQWFTGAARRELLFRGRDAIEQILAFVKQMSHKDINDYRYLYEREWRVVAGISVNDQLLARALTLEEKTELGARRPRWCQPLEVHDRPCYFKDHVAMIDLFRLFNGVGQRTVAQCITQILVPHIDVMKRVVDYIVEHRAQFGAVTPRVRLMQSAENTWTILGDRSRQPLSIDDLSRMVAALKESEKRAAASMLGTAPTAHEVSAYHEASHAVAAVTLGVAFSHVYMHVYQHTAQPGDIVGGLHLAAAFRALLQTGEPANADDRRKSEQLAIVAIAGEAGQAVFEERPCDIRQESAEGDFEIVKKLAGKLYAESAERDAFIERQTQAACELVNDPLRIYQIEYLASQLKILLELTYDSVVEAMATAEESFAEEGCDSATEE